MDVSVPEADPQESIEFDEAHDFFMAGDNRLGQVLNETESIRTVGEISAGQFPDDGGVASDLSPVEQERESRIAEAEMIDPHGGVDEDHRSPGASTSGDRAEVFRRPAEPRQPLGAFPGDQRLQAHPDQGRLLFDSGQLGSLAEDLVVDIDRRSHMHEYAIFMHICRRPFVIIADDRGGLEFSLAPKRPLYGSLDFDVMSNSFCAAARESRGGLWHGLCSQ